MKRVAILGSTGSIGQSALAVVAAHPDRLRVVALSAGENVPRFVEQVAQYAPDMVAMATAAGLAEVIEPHTRGNPYEAVELLDGLRRDGLLATTAAGWRCWPT